MLNSFVVIVSEIALALYPILIKKVDTDLTTQLVSRTLTFSVMAALLGGKEDIQRTWGSLASAGQSFVLGLVTLLHVGMSYYAFQQLTTGVSMSLFYTYPFFNLLFGMLLFRDKASPFQLLMMIIAFIGVAFVAPEIKEGFLVKEPKPAEAQKEETRYDWKGIAAGIGAAISETVMYFAVKNVEQPSAYYSMLNLYPGALFALLGYMLFRGETIDTRAQTWIPMILFNVLVGFVGYALRFYAIPKLSTIVFSVLSFIGVVAAFGWGYVFVREVPTWKSLLGATLITGAVGLSGAPA